MADGVLQELETTLNTRYKTTTEEYRKKVVQRDGHEKASADLGTYYSALDR